MTALPPLAARALDALTGSFAAARGGGARPAEIVQALSLGPGSRLLVVRFGGRQLLVGQSRAGLVRLGEAEQP